MTSRLLVAALILGSALVSSSPTLAQAPPKEAVPLPFGVGAWDLRPMEEDPVKLVKTTYDREAKEARFILEFTRDLTVRDTAWSGVRPEPPFRFEFEDRDGVTLGSEPAKYDGVLIGLKGRRIRVVLKMPAESVMVRTQKVKIDLKATTP